MKKIVLIGILIAALVSAVWGGVTLAGNSTNALAMRGQKLVGLANYGALLYRLPGAWYDSSIFITNPDCKYDKSLLRAQVMDIAGNVVWEVAFPAEDQDGILSPHETLSFPLHWLLGDTRPVDETDYSVYTVEVFWKGQGLPLEGFIKDMVINGDFPDNEGDPVTFTLEAMSDHPMTNMRQ